MHGTDDHIVPIADPALLAVKLLNFARRRSRVARCAHR
jgi:hypothetical protein